MKEVRSFSLDEIVAKKVDEIPKNERSRKINQILREALLNEKKQEISLESIKTMLESINQEKSPAKNHKVRESLESIMNMRK